MASTVDLSAKAHGQQLPSAFICVLVKIKLSFQCLYRRLSASQVERL